MKKINKVISLELAKELKEIAGINNFELPESELVYINETLRFHRQDNLYNPIPAFDACELGEILPKSLDDEEGWKKIWSAKIRMSGWRIQVGEKHFEEADTEAEARGKMLIYLIKNKLI